ncbi:hypothetical protein ACFWB0_21895 [Rhodococcus sp. NPDC060086]|uniref:hypothetical protein n=1 Tax=Rhodococcus sp. NPDC060086 TaxID=3347055 RepID=UPI00364B1DE1
MSDSNGERRSFRSGGSTPWSGRSGDDRRNDRGEERKDDRGQPHGGAGRPSRGRDDRRGDDRRGSDSRSGDRPYGDRPRQDRSGGERGSGDRGRQGSGFGRSDDRRGGEDRRGDRPGHSGRPSTPSGDRRTSDDRRGSGGDHRGSGPDRGAPRRRGGEGGFDPKGREGVRPQRREARPDEPDLPDDLEASELDPTIRRDLLSLDKANANAVARHLVMAGRLIDDDVRTALSHARAARQRAGRIAVVREAAGITAYHAGEWAEALSELRAARRMSGGTGLLAVMADCERGLGRPEKAVELGRSEEARKLTGDEASELRIVVAGARMDLGQIDQAVVTLQTPDLDPERTGTSAARLFYAYADALVAAGRTDEGLQWFLHSSAADLEGVTDAEERVDELTGDNL